MKGPDNLNVNALGTRTLKSMKDQTNGTGKEKKTNLQLQSEVSISPFLKNKLEQVESQDIEDLSITVNLLFLPLRTLHASRPEYTFVSSVRGSFSSTNHTLSDF